MYKYIKTLFIYKIHLLKLPEGKVRNVYQNLNKQFMKIRYYIINYHRRNQDLKMWRQFSLLQWKSIVACDRVQNGLRFARVSSELLWEFKKILLPQTPDLCSVHLETAFILSIRKSSQTLLAYNFWKFNFRTLDIRIISLPSLFYPHYRIAQYCWGQNYLVLLTKGLWDTDLTWSLLFQWDQRCHKLLEHAVV